MPASSRRALRWAAHVALAFVRLSCAKHARVLPKRESASAVSRSASLHIAVLRRSHGRTTFYSMQVSRLTIRRETDIQLGKVDSNLEGDRELLCTEKRKVGIKAPTIQFGCRPFAWSAS